MHLFLLQHGDALAESVNPQRPLSEQGRSDVERLTEVHDYLEDRFARHLNLLRTRSERT